MQVGLHAEKNQLASSGKLKADNFILMFQVTPCQQLNKID